MVLADPNHYMIHFEKSRDICPNFLFFNAYWPFLRFWWVWIRLRRYSRADALERLLFFFPNTVFPYFRIKRIHYGRQDRQII